MFQSQKADGEDRRSLYELIVNFACENRSVFRAACFMTALGLFVTVIVSTVPQTGRLVKMSFGQYRAAVSVQETDIDFLSAEHAAADVSVPELDEMSEMFRQLAAADEIRLRNENGTGVFSRYITVIPAAEAQETLDEIAAAKARAEALRQARAAVTTTTQYTSYVHINTNGVPMSQKGDVAVDENGVPLHYRYKIVGKATAYTGDPITATGTRPVQGTVAVDPREIPYGTRMYITSADGKYVYGLAVAEDTGGFIYFRNGATVDLFMYSYDDCCVWGWRSANIYILD
jgi:3D (Asp-Asp-Asp) domain-containing protein